jgi:hypothetical protein
MVPAGGADLANDAATVDLPVLGGLDALALDGVAGAVEISGSPGGTVYLEAGCVTFAESSAVPDLATRLIGSRRLSVEQWAQLVAESPYTGVGALLTGRGFISEDELQLLLRSIALDAIMALTLPEAGGPHEAGIRFTPLVWHWAGKMLRMDMESVRTEVVQRAERLARFTLPSQARPRLADLRQAWALVSREQWLLAAKIDGVATIGDLAWQNGLALHDTLEWVGELVSADLCALLSPAVAAPPEPDVAHPAHPLEATARDLLRDGAAVAPPPGPPPLPRRRRTAARIQLDRRADRDGGSADPAMTGLPLQDLLRQVLEGLRRL